MSLKHKLDYHYRYFDFSQISPDPLEFPHRFSSDPDIEISAFLSSVFAYGNVKMIQETLEKVHTEMGESPYDFLMNYRTTKNYFNDLYFRFYTTEDIKELFRGLRIIFEEYGSLRYLFLLYYFENEENLKSAIKFFSGNLMDIVSGSSDPSPGMKFMFPDPCKNSACKRMNLFLRWMVRKDELDFGLWPEVSPSQLVIPVDTHVARICGEIGLTARKTVSWKMAEEITGKLKEFDPEDPVKYDFAICHIGMRKMEF